MDPATRPAERLTPRESLLWAAWFGLLTGLAQTAIVSAARAFTGRLVFITSDIIWRGPVANTVLFCLVGLTLTALMRRVARRTALAVLAGAFVVLATFGVAVQVPGLHPYAAAALVAGFAVQAGRLTHRHQSLVSTGLRRSLPYIAAATAMLVAGYVGWQAVQVRRWQDARGAAPAGAPNVLLVVLDTVRASSLSLHGYPRATSPHLERFARTGVMFENAIATAPWTLPSHASLFTGHAPRDVSANWLSPLDSTHATLAEAFRDRGYDTVGEVANLLYATTPTGLARGFIHYRDFPATPQTLVEQSWLFRPVLSALAPGADEGTLVPRKTARDVTDGFLEWSGHPRERPFFAFLNYFDAHMPYMPPSPYDTAFGSGGPMPDITRRRQWSPAEIQRSRDAYDGAITFIDAELARLLETLEQRGQLSNTIVVITSDHGEQFGEHGLFDHANSLYLPLLHVPLIIWNPGRVPQGARVTTPVSLVNLAATIATLSGDDRRSLPGAPLSEYWSTSGAPSTAAPVLSEVSKGINTNPRLPVSRGDMQSVVLGGVHYIRNGDGVEELYDFERDRAETRNVTTDASYGAVLDAARRAVDAHLGKH